MNVHNSNESICIWNWVCLSFMLFHLFQLNYCTICYLCFSDLQVCVFVQKQHKHVLEFWVPVLILRILIISFVLLWGLSDYFGSHYCHCYPKNTVKFTLLYFVVDPFDSEVDWLLCEWKVTAFQTDVIQFVAMKLILTTK